LGQTKIDSASFNGNRFGLKGSEDLGGGLSVVFDLVNGFNIDSGSAAQSGLLFGRRAAVGFASTSWGTVLFGRNTGGMDDVAADAAMGEESAVGDPSSTNNGPSIATAQALANTAAGSVNFLNRTTTWIGYNSRFNNSVKYTSPTFSGFSGSVMYAMGEDKTPTLDPAASYSVWAKYANGPILVGLAFQSEGGGGSGGATNVAPFPATVTATTKPALENTLLNLSYDFGVAKVGAQFNRAIYKDVKVAGVDFAAQNEAALSVVVPVGAARISATVAQSSGDTLGKATGFGIQATYALSKRTYLYAGGVSTQNYDTLAAAVQAANPLSTIARSTLYAAGINHKF